MRDNKEIHDAVVDGVCSDYKGFNTYHYNDWNSMDCDVYNDEYDEIKLEWEQE